MKLHHLKPAEGSTSSKRRVARGDRGKGGKTAGRGTKGTGARGSGKVGLGFEGGQMPLNRRQPKLPGFGTPPNQIQWAIVNVATLEQKFEAGDEVTPETLRARGIGGKKRRPVKVLGHGDITKALTVQVDAVSATAHEKILAAGGTVAGVGSSGGSAPAQDPAEAAGGSPQ